MEAIPFLILLAFVGLLVILRFDAKRFETAEYDDIEAPGGWRKVVRQVAWYALGIALVAAIYRLHPLPVSQLHLTLGDERSRAIIVGLAFGAVGTFVAFAFAWFRYRHLRLPAARHVPGGMLNSIGTAFLDEAVFRGIVLGLVLSYSWPAELAIAFQAILYALATRLGAAGRSRAMLLVSIGVGVAAGFLTLQSNGIGAAFVGHAITRFAIFLAVGHAGQVRAPEFEVDEEGSRILSSDQWDAAQRERRVRSIQTR